MRREINLRDTHFNKGMSTGVDFNICVISPPTAIRKQKTKPESSRGVTEEENHGNVTQKRNASKKVSVF